MSAFSRYWDGLKRTFIPGQGAPEPVMLYWAEDSERQQKAVDYLRYSNAVYVCNRVRSQSLSSLPLRLYKTGRNRRTEVERGELHELLQKVNPYWTFQRLIEMTEMSLGVWGDSYWFLDRGQNGRSTPREIWWVPSTKVQVVRDNRDYIKRFDYTPDNASQPIPFRTDEVIWFRYPNPGNEFEGLSPLSAAMLAADAGRAAAASNSKLFSAGIQMAGTISPAGGTNASFTEEQAQQIEQAINRRFRDPKSANKWAVLRQDIKFQPLSVTPKDAEFLGTLNWSLEEIARAYGVPLDLVGGQRTYENYNAAQLDLWYRTLLPEARFIANELTEQLLPMFPGQADVCEFDSSDVPVLQEAERARWDVDERQIKAGAIILNEWRDDQGLDPVPWGDVWWAPVGLTPVKDATDPLALTPVAAQHPSDDEKPPESEPRMLTRSVTRGMEYGSPEHRAFMQRQDQRRSPREQMIGDKTADLMRRQRQAVLARLRQRSATRDIADVVDSPFDLPRWLRTFRTEMRPILREILGDAGQESLDDLGVGGINFDLFDPNVINALERQVQRFAQEVNQTTWDRLKTALGEGYEAGESVDKLADRVQDVMGDRIRSSNETIARTESNITHSNADLMSWQQSGVVGGKRWLAALDDRTRSSHVEAHGQIVGLDAEFNVGGNRMQGPGIGGPASEVVNCRCSMTPVLDIDMPE